MVLRYIVFKPKLPSRFQTCYIKGRIPLTSLLTLSIDTITDMTLPSHSYHNSKKTSVIYFNDKRVPEHSGTLFHHTANFPSENFSTYGRFKVYLALLPHLTANMRAAQWPLGPHRYFISPRLRAGCILGINLDYAGVSLSCYEQSSRMCQPKHILCPVCIACVLSLAASAFLRS